MELSPETILAPGCWGWAREGLGGLKRENNHRLINSTNTPRLRRYPRAAGRESRPGKEPMFGLVVLTSRTGCRKAPRASRAPGHLCSIRLFPNPLSTEPKG